MSSERKWRRGDRLKVTRGQYAQKTGTFVYGVEDDKGEGSYVVQLDGMGIAIVSSREFIFLPPSNANSTSNGHNNSSRPSQPQMTHNPPQQHHQDSQRKRTLEDVPQGPYGKPSSVTTELSSSSSDGIDTKKPKLTEEEQRETHQNETPSTGSATFKNAHTNAPQNNSTAPCTSTC